MYSEIYPTKLGTCWNLDNAHAWGHKQPFQPLRLCWSAWWTSHQRPPLQCPSHPWQRLSEHSQSWNSSDCIPPLPQRCWPAYAWPHGLKVWHGTASGLSGMSGMSPGKCSAWEKWQPNKTLVVSSMFPAKYFAFGKWQPNSRFAVSSLALSMWT